MPDEPLKVLILHHNAGETPVRLLNEREGSPYILGLASEARQCRGVGLANHLIEPRRSLHLRAVGRVSQQHPHPVKVLAGVKDVLQLVHQLDGALPHTAIEVHQQAVVVVVDLEIVAGVLVEQHPAAPAKDLNVPLVVDGEHGDDLLSQRPFAAHPGNEAIHPLPPPSSGRRSWSLSNCSSDCVSPWIAAAMPLMRCVMCAMVARTSCSEAA